MARCNKSAYAILGIISKGEVSGYDIKKLLQKTGRFYWSESNAQIYPTLKQLEDHGKVTSRLDESSGARQCRKYSITPKGKKCLLEWLSEPCEFPKYREEILLKIGLGQHVPIETLIGHVKHYGKEIAERIDYLAVIDDHIKTAHANRPDMPFLLITYNQISSVLHAKQQWVKETLVALEEMKVTA